MTKNNRILSSAKKKNPKDLNQNFQDDNDKNMAHK